ncbi:hypothetical protein P7H22_16460 [Paenibacillus larvae]|nr:hypothetical protein [Paenibacillus larvae]MDT2241626.1 hypothetical protein [Paenibacillus larvae]
MGAKVSIDHSEVTILIEKGIYPVPNKKVLAAGVMEPFLNRVLKAYSLWNGGDENKGPFSSLSPWKDYKLRNMTDGRPDTFFGAMAHLKREIMSGFTWDIGRIYTGLSSIWAQ